MRHAPCRPRRTAALAVVAVAVLALAGCSSDDREPKQGSRPVGGDGSPAATDAGPDAGSDAGPDAGPAANTPVTGDVTLLDAGAAPRRVVLLEVEEGHRETTTMSMTTTTTTAGEEITLPMTVPLTTTVTGVSSSGIAAEVVYGRPTIEAGDLPPDAVAQAQAALDLLEGTRATVTYAPNGTVVTSEVEASPDAPDLVARLLDNISSLGYATLAAFPDEEVGVGGRWEATTTFTVGGLEQSATTSYRLTALDDDGYELSFTGTTTTTPGDTVGGKVLAGSGNARGTLVGRTGLIAPDTSRTTGRGRTVVEVGGQRVETSYRTTMRLTTR